jgi:hypothetical protein
MRNEVKNLKQFLLDAHARLDVKVNKDDIGQLIAALIEFHKTPRS